MASDYHNALAQDLYGVVILGISFSNMAISKSLKAINPDTHFGLLYNLTNRSLFIDLGSKAVGLNSLYNGLPTSDGLCHLDSNEVAP